MLDSLQLVVTTGMALAAAVVTYRLVKAQLFPPSVVQEFTGSSDRLMVAQTELVLRRGIRTVKWPVMLIVFVATIVADRVTPARTAAIVFCAGVVVALAWRRVALRRWWRWAMGQPVDPSLVEELAEDAVLIWRHDTWIGRRQRRAWRQLPPASGTP